MIIVSLLSTLLSGGFVAAKHFWRGETMKIKEVCKKWGQTPFNENEFRKGNEAVRARMACSLLHNQKKYLGKDRSEIRRKLGDHDGFYFSDMFPAYMIQSAKSKEEDSWQIVFFLNRNEKVSEVMAHKNCCDR